MKNLKNITKASQDDLIDIFRENKKLQEVVENYLICEDMDYISRVLSYFKETVISYSLGYDNHNYFITSNKTTDDFIEETLNIFYDVDDKEVYDFYIESDLKVMLNLQELNNKLKEMEQGEDYEKLKEKMLKMKYELERLTLMRFKQSMWSDDLKNIALICFIDNYEEFLDKDSTYFNTETYELFEHIDYLKSYK